MMNKIIEFLKSKFEMKDVCEATYVLDTTTSRDKSLKMLYLDQEKI